MDHNYFLIKVLDYAKFSLENDRSPSNSILVNKWGDIISQSSNLVITENDPTAHSEIVCIREAAKKTKSLDLSGLTLYTAIEPCLMCLCACYWSKVKRIVYVLGRDKLEVASYEGNINNKEIITKLNSYISLEHTPEFEERMLDLMGIWEDRQKKYWRK